VLYLGGDEAVAFVETFGRGPGPAFVTRSALRARRLSRVEARRPLRLVDLRGEGLARIGADERLCAGEYALAQRWSRAIWRHPLRPDGVLYRARHDPSRTCAALFDRCAVALRVHGVGSLSDPTRLATWLDAYGLGLVDE